jgi:hypothetical protein
VSATEMALGKKWILLGKKFRKTKNTSKQVSIIIIIIIIIIIMFLKG